MKTVVILSLLSALLSLTSPWYVVAALAAGFSSFRKKNIMELIFVSLGITFVNMVISIFLDFQASWLISQRIGALFDLPFFFLVHVFAGLIPGLVFFATALVTQEGRVLVKRPSRFSEKSRWRKA